MTISHHASVRSREMRIAYVINSVEGGGAALPVPSIVGLLRRSGAAVRVFALTPRDGRAIPAMNAADIDLVVRTGGDRDHLDALRWLDRAVFEWSATHIWTSLTRATALGQLVGLRRRLPVVSWQHAAYLKPANLRLLRTTRRLSRIWIGDSEPITRITAERLNLPAGRLATWPIFRADPSMPQAQPWRPGEPIRLGSLGRLHPVKGYDVMIDALAALPGSARRMFRVTIGGDGRERERLTARAASLGVEIRFDGFVEDTHRWLAEQHVYLQPSRSEGLCVAAHEAMAAGLPVIASRVGALPASIIEGLNGRLVPPGDSVALANAITAIVTRPDRIAVMGAAARRSVLDRFGPQYFDAAGLAILNRLRAIETQTAL